MRIQKWISRKGMASRREAERWILEGRVSINDKVVKEMGVLFDPESDSLKIDGKTVDSGLPPRVFWMLNKPYQILTAREDGFGRKTIYDLDCLKSLPFLVSPVGRLDYRSEGLLLLTNEGELAHKLCHPSFKVPRHYQVLVNGRLTAEQEKQIRSGVELEDGMVLGTELIYAHGEKLGRSKGSWYFVTVYEGRNRLVRRIFAKMGLDVIRLLRYGFGTIKMEETLEPGTYRQLTSKEIQYLKSTVEPIGTDTSKEESK